MIKMLELVAGMEDLFIYLFYQWVLEGVAAAEGSTIPVPNLSAVWSGTVIFLQGAKV